jgi:hypothetical protein
MSSSPSTPIVTVVTPNLDQGRFLRHAVDSVLQQDYPHIDYLVVDGGSTDESLEVLRSYGSRLRWISEPDTGQASAINKGFRDARGSILAWINADDALADGAVTRVVEAFSDRPDLGLVYGNGTILDEDGVVTGPFEFIEPFSLWRLLYNLDYILQPAAFFRRSAFEDAGGLDEGLHFGMDWDLWIRLAAVSEVQYLDAELGCSREYGETKTSTGGWRRIRELCGIARRHTGRSWTPGTKLYALDALHRKLRATLPPALHRGLGAITRRLIASVTSSIPVHADGWLAPASKLVVPRRWRHVEARFEADRLPASGAFAIRLSTPDGTLVRHRISEPGPFSVHFDIPDGAEDGFMTIDLRSDFSFRAGEEKRLLSVRCLELGPG